MISVLQNNVSDRPMDLTCDVSLKLILKCMKQVAKEMQMPVEITEDTFGVTDGALFSGIFASANPCIAIYHKDHKRDYHSVVVERKSAYGRHCVYIHLGGTSANQRSINMGKSYTYVQDGHIKQSRPGFLGRMFSNEGKEGMRDEQLYYDAVVDMVAESLVRAEVEHTNPKPKTPTPPQPKPKAPTPQPKKPNPIQTASTDPKPEPTKTETKPVAGNVLQTSIGLETMGGVCTKMIAAGTALPAEKTMIFSTAADNQISVEIHILRGESDKVAENQSMGKYMLKDIPPMKRGVPQIQLTFEVDVFGDLEVSAKELTSGNEIQVVVDLPDAPRTKAPEPMQQEGKTRLAECEQASTYVCDLTLADGHLAADVILQAKDCKPILTMKKDTVLPESAAAVVIIQAQNRAAGEVCLYEGEKLLGTLRFSGIPCEEDCNGCIEVDLFADAQGKLKVYGENMETEKALTVSFEPVASASGLFANGMDNVTRLRELKALLDEGILTRDEFEAEKKKILG